MPPGDHTARLRTLRKRRDFLAAARAKRCASPGLVVQKVRRSPGGGVVPVGAVGATEVGVGFTASKKVGNAVARNRAKRRMRALAAEILPHRGQPGCDYVLIARQALLARPYGALRGDLLSCLDRLGKEGLGKDRRGKHDRQGRA